MRRHSLLKYVVYFLVVYSIPPPSSHGDFLCAGYLNSTVATEISARASKPTRRPIEGNGNALVLFARFHGENTGGDLAPGWSRDIFDPQKPGSFSHFYDTMSLGKLRIRGEIASRQYESLHPASAYLADEPDAPGAYGQFTLEILEQADRDIDFTRYDSDGPDGIPNSGDDDGWVDALFLVLPSTPESFLLGAATGMANLGLPPWDTDDLGVSGDPIRVATWQGSIQRGRTFAETVGSMCHEYGHVLGLPDLYNTAYLRQQGAPQEKDSAGIGAWGLMGWGALGWNGDDGPVSFSAWSRMELGWAQVAEPSREHTDLELEDVGIAGAVFKVPLYEKECFLLEHRRRASTHYDRHLPAEGLLIWHVDQVGYPVQSLVDLECADGRWRSAGSPRGDQPDPDDGGDNLDFWAHDPIYTAQHGGNQGDATDPFDGIRFRAFTPATNPAARSNDGLVSARIENIRIEENTIRAAIEVSPARIELTGVYFADTRTDESVLAGKEIPINFKLANRGGYRLTELTVRLSSDDPLVEIPDPQIELKDLEVGREEHVMVLAEEDFPRLRIARDFAVTYTGTATLEIYAGPVLLARRELTVPAHSSHTLSGVATDENGVAIADIEIRVWGRKNYNATIRTRQDGSFELFLPEDIYDITVNPGKKEGFATQEFNSISISQDTTFPILLLATHTLFGIVRDAAGNPVSRVRVWASRDDGIYAYAHTGADGSYTLEIPRGIYQIEFYSSSDGAHLPPFTLADVQVEGETQLDPHLPSGVRVILEITDEDGTGIAGVEASLYRGDTTRSQRARTDLDGRAEFHLLPGVSHSLGFYTLPSSFVKPTSITVEATTDTTIQIVLSKGILATGQVLDDEGHPVEFGRLWIYPEEQTTFTSTNIQNGRFSIALESGRYRFRFLTFGTQLHLPNQELGLFEVQEGSEFDLVVKRGQTLEGNIIDDRGVPLMIGDGQIAFRPRGEGVAMGSLVENGTYRTGLLPGSYQVYFYSFTESIYPFQELGFYTITEADTHDFTVRRGTAVEGHLEGVEVIGADDLSVQAISVDGSSMGSSSIHADGSFQLRLLPGAYRIGWTKGSSSGLTSWAGGKIQVPTATPTFLEQPSAVTFSGRVTDSHGRPLESSLLLTHSPHPPDALFAQWQENFVASQNSRADGSYRIPLGAGRYDLVIFGKSTAQHRLGWVRREIDLTEDREEDFIFPEPEQTHQLSGIIFDRQSSFIDRGEIQFYDEQSGYLGHASIATGAGRYALAIPPGNYHATLGISGILGGYAETHYLGQLQLTEDTEWDVHLTPAETAIDGSDTLPPLFALHPNYPNPFNAGTVILYQFPRTTHVELTIYNIAGQRLKTLIDEPQHPGLHRVTWDGTDASGQQVGTGLYLYKLTTPAKTQTRRMILIK